MGRISQSFARTASALALGIGLAVGQASVAVAQDAPATPSASVPATTGIPAWGITGADIAPDPDFSVRLKGLRFFVVADFLDNESLHSILVPFIPGP